MTISEFVINFIMRFADTNTDTLTDTLTLTNTLTDTLTNEPEGQNKIAGNKSLCLIEDLISLMNNSQIEVRDLISKDLMVYLLLTLNKNDKMNLLEKLISNLKNCNVNVYSANSNLDKEIIMKKISENLTSIFLMGSYLCYFDLSKSHFVEIDKIIVCLRNFNKKCLKNKGAESKIIKGIITDFFNRYKHTFEYVKLNLSEEAIETINDLSKSHSYFM